MKEKDEKPKHTPGPWKRYGSGQFRGEHYTMIRSAAKYRGISLELYGDIARTYGATDEREANAHLIAAAPETAAERDRLKKINKDLVKALRQIEATPLNVEGYNCVGSIRMRFVRMLTIARAAIAKAEGE